MSPNVHYPKQRAPHEAHCGAKRGFVQALAMTRDLSAVTCAKCRKSLARGVK